MIILQTNKKNSTKIYYLTTSLNSRTRSEESEKEDSKADLSMAEATSTAESSDEKCDRNSDEANEENQSNDAGETSTAKATEGVSTANSSKADDSNMEALQLTEPDDLYDEYRDVRYFFEKNNLVALIFIDKRVKSKFLTVQ